MVAVWRHGRMGWPWTPAMDSPSTPCGRATPETALRPSFTFLDTPRSTPIFGGSFQLSFCSITKRMRIIRNYAAIAASWREVT
jgi:hypothetical protein